MLSPTSFDPMDYFIVDSTADLLEPIAIYKDKEKAFENLQHFCSVYPQGWIEVLSEEEFINAKG